MRTPISENRSSPTDVIETPIAIIIIIASSVIEGRSSPVKNDSSNTTTGEPAFNI